MSCGGSVSAMCAMPTLELLASTVAMSMAPRLCSSSKIFAPTLKKPGEVSMMLWSSYLPEAIPAATKNGLMDEPGSKMSVAARLR